MRPRRITTLLYGLCSERYWTEGPNVPGGRGKPGEVTVTAVREESTENIMRVRLVFFFVFF